MTPLAAELSLSTVIALRDAGLPLPAALVLLSPWVDLSLSGNTIKTHAAQDAMLSEDWLTWCAKTIAAKNRQPIQRVPHSMLT